jgi:hypothetical protein
MDSRPRIFSKYFWASQVHRKQDIPRHFLYLKKVKFDGGYCTVYPPLSPFSSAESHYVFLSALKEYQSPKILCFLTRSSEGSMRGEPSYWEILI